MSNEHPPYITTTKGMRGHFAVLLTWNSDHGGFYEPYTTGLGSFDTQSGAVGEAVAWATDEGVEYRAAPLDTESFKTPVDIAKAFEERGFKVHRLGEKRK